MEQPFLYNTLLTEFGKRNIFETEIPDSISKNLKHTMRPYQREAFQRFLTFINNDFDKKQPRPYHLLYNMATGSGKTLIMAGVMLYLFERGYRNFLFFVNSNNIILKTKDNFLNANTSKYLFADKIIIGGKQISVQEIENFDEADDNSINIKFVSIQMLTSGLLLNVRENGLSFEDFENMKLVLIGDEAHHNNAEVWGELVEKIHKMNYDNILLEFTATTDYDEKKIRDKYLNKVIFRYALSEFRKDRYSKEINLLRSQFDERHRVIQALVLSLYRQELATSHNINLKPVILFKAKKTIAESQRNKENFHELIDNLSAKEINEVRNGQNINILQKAFAFFDSKDIDSNEIAKRLKSNFRRENCLSANDDKETEQNQIRLNTLEDENNPIRAVFAVQKLNEGWDVLNLFDIVRMYEERNEEKDGVIGKTTLAEAQLIGRGARYFPFALEKGQDKFTRKFDNDVDNDLKVLEELYYHTKEDSRYISELKKALKEIYDDENDIVEKKLTLKESFKKTDFYRYGNVIYNLKIEKSHKKVKSLSDLKVRKTNIEFALSSGQGSVTIAFEEEEPQHVNIELNERKDVKVSDIQKHIVYYALAANPFFNFINLRKYCPNIGSKDEFIDKEEYLGGFGITFKGDKSHCGNITNYDYFQALKVLLGSIENEIKQNDTEYEGSEFTFGRLRDKFADKTLHINKKANEERTNGQESFLADKEWYAYNANYGTMEEKKFVEMFASRYENLKEKFDDIFLIRNEQVLKIYDEIGRTFEPDFILFCKRKTGEEQVLQVFIEPKGGHLESRDKWKEEFLRQLRKDKKTIEIGTDNYLITGVPFYNYSSENDFKKELEDTLAAEK